MDCRVNRGVGKGVLLCRICILFRVIVHFGSQTNARNASGVVVHLYVYLMNILRCPSSNIPNELECINSLVDLHSHPSKAQLPRWPERYPYLCTDNVKGTAAFYHLKSERTCQKEITFIIIIHFIVNLFPLISTRDARQLL